MHLPFIIIKLILFYKKLLTHILYLKVFRDDLCFCHILAAQDITLSCNGQYTYLAPAMMRRTGGACAWPVRSPPGARRQSRLGSRGARCWERCWECETETVRPAAAPPWARRAPSWNKTPSTGSHQRPTVSILGSSVIFGDFFYYWGIK